MIDFAKVAQWAGRLIEWAVRLRQAAHAKDLAKVAKILGERSVLAEEREEFEAKIRAKFGD